jgi:two-component system, NtrC family, sensor histidine kinase HydH
MPPRFLRLIHAPDFVWLALFSALALVSPRRSDAELQVLAGLTLLQVVAPRIQALSSPRGNLLVIALKLVLGFLLLGVTGGIASSYYPILLLPVVSAATTLGGWGTAVVTLLACVADLLYIPVALRLGYELSFLEVRDAVLRVIFLPVVGYLTWQLAESTRTETRRAQTVAGQLAQANQDLREAEANVRRTERLAALGQLTAGLAHELRNPMGTMKASAEMLARQVANSGPVAVELAGYISSEVDRTNSLITRFLEFARPLQIRREACDLNELAERTVRRVEREQAGSGISLHLNLAPELRPIAADGELLERALANLLVNAIQASPQGSTVTLKTRPTEHGAEIAVIDRGSGIAPELLEQVFNPFFTTKKDGVGLGLAIVSKIVDEHGGHLSVKSEPGKGTHFLVDLPIV